VLSLSEDPQPSEGCPRANGYFRHSDAQICDKFFNCVDGVPNVLPCPPGLIYDDTRSTCAWPAESRRTDCVHSKRGNVLWLTGWDSSVALRTTESLVRERSSWQHESNSTEKLSRNRHSVDKGERRYSSYSLFASTLDGVSGRRHASAGLYLLEKDSRYPVDRRLGGPQSRSGHRGWRKNHLPGIVPRSLGRPVCNRTLF
jgi:hypothetical protein